MTTHPSIRARLEAATPGDWYALPSHVVEGNAQVRVKTAKEDYLLCELPSDAVADLIAHAPTGLATLLAENDALRERVETVRNDALEEAVEIVDCISPEFPKSAATLIDAIRALKVTTP